MSTAPAKNATFRVLPPEEHAQLADLFEQHGGTLPPPELSMAVVGDVGGKLAFVCVPVTAVFVEHMYVAPEHRGTGLWREGCEAVMAALAERGVGGFLCLAPDDRMAHMAEECGLEEVPYKLYRKVL